MAWRPVRRPGRTHETQVKRRDRGRSCNSDCSRCGSPAGAGVLTLEDLAEKLTLLTADQDELKERLAALEAAAASTNWLAGIPIQAENRCTPYKASDYKYAQMLEAQIVPETGGRIYSPYTGETFARADEVDIEHIVARSEAHDSGLCSADTFTRLAFASDMLNLTFASPQVNREQKGDKDVADWLPDLNQCWFVNRVVAVKRRSGLSMDAREAAAARSVLEACPSVAMEIVAARKSSLRPLRKPRPRPVETSRNSQVRSQRAIHWNCTTTTATAASPAQRPASTASRRFAATILLISICEIRMETGWCVSRWERG